MTTVVAPSVNIIQEVHSTLKLLDTMRQELRRDEVPGWVWLRAARACWLTGDLDRAKENYRRAAPLLTSLALGTGRRTGNVEQYANLALGAAWMTQEKNLLADTTAQIMAVAGQLAVSVDNPPEPLFRASLLLTHLRAAWYRHDVIAMEEVEPELERRVNSLDAWSRLAWQQERASNSFAVLRGLTNKTDAILGALHDLDTVLKEQRGTPPSVTDLVDEEFISFVAGTKDLNVKLPHFVTPTEPGAFA